MELLSIKSATGNNKTMSELMVEISRLYKRFGTSAKFVFMENYKGTSESIKAIKRHDYTVQIGFSQESGTSKSPGERFVVLQSATADSFENALHQIVRLLNAVW